MTIANTIPVPVETLEIVKIPGINTLKNRDNWWVAGFSENRRKLTFTFRTPASSHTFKRKVYILDAQAFESDGSRDPNDPLAILKPERPVLRVILKITLGDEEFHGSFDYLTDAGELNAYQYTDEDAIRDGNNDYWLAERER